MEKIVWEELRAKEEIFKKALYKAYGDSEGKYIFYLKDMSFLLNPEGIARDVFFSHEFAKAFWGEDRYYHFDGGSLCRDVDDKPAIFTLKEIKADDEEYLIEDGNYHKGNYHWYLPVWQYHLQQIVLYKNPLKYLEQYL